METIKSLNKKFTHIIHLADIHVRLTRRHEEYIQVFDRLYEEIKKTPPESIICLLGDTVHSKLDLSPECLQTTKDLLCNLADIRPVVLVSGNHDCYTPDHEILTKNGWKTIKEYVDINCDKDVATFNENSKEIEFQKPIGLIKKNFVGEMYNIIGKSIDACVTPTHQVLYYHTQTNKFYKKEASQLPKTGLIPINGIINNYIEDNFYKLLGFTFAEGTFILRNHKINTDENKYNGCRIQFHLKCKREIDYLSFILNKLNYKFNIKPQKDNSFFIVIYSDLAKKICKFFNNKKEIPNHIFNNNNSQLKSFVDGYLNGGGHKFKNKYNYWTFSSISKESIDKLYTISRLIGASSTKSKREIFGNYKNSKQQYLAGININDRINNTSIKDIKKINYNGMVYCITVPNTNLLIRHNDKIFICGNCNLSNKSRLDCLSPIVDAIKHPNLTYLKKSGLYGYGNILFNNYSVFDDSDEYLKGSDIPTTYRQQYDRIVGLYHGIIDGVMTDNGYLATHEIKLSQFDDHDIILLGDIHLAQTPQECDNITKPIIRYPGSLIQQSHGEPVYGHGFSLWDLKQKSFKHVEIPNDYGFITLNVIDGKIDSIEPDTYPKKTRLRIKHLNSDATSLKSIVANIRLKSEVVEGFFMRLDTTRSSNLATNITIKDLTNIDYQNQLITNHLKNKLGIIDEDLINLVLKINKDTNSIIKTNDITRNVKWIPKRFEWENMFSYGAGNVIDFSKLKDVVGIFAPNKSGKSSILSALSFCIWDKFDRNFKGCSVLNSKKTSFKCKFNFEINDIDYFIEKTGISDKNHNVKVNVKFWKVENGSKIDLNGDDRRDTGSLIREYIGTYEDFILTSLSIQGGRNVNSFLDLGNTERKDLLVQFLGLDIFDKLYEASADKLNELEKSLKTYRNDDFTKKLVDNTNALFQHESLYKEEQKLMSQLVTQKDDLHNQVEKELKKYIQTGLYNTPNPLTDHKTLLFSQTEIDRLKNTIEKETLDLKEIGKRFTAVDESIKELENKSVSSVFKECQIYKAKTDELTYKLENVREDARRKLEKIKKLEGYKYDPKCSFCLMNNDSLVQESNKARQELEVDKVHYKNWKDEKDEFVKKFENSKWSIEAYEMYSKLLSSRNNIMDEYESLNEKLKQYKKFLEEHKQKIQRAEANIKLYETFKDAIDNNRHIDLLVLELKSEISKVSAEINKKQSNVLTLNSKISIFQKQIDDIKIKVKEAKEVESLYKIYDLYIQCIGRNGIPYEVISSVLPTLERETNEILSQIDDDLQAHFEVDGKNIVSYIIQNDSQYLMDLASGYEKFVLSLAIRVALINISNLPKSSFLILDEGFGAVDSHFLPSVAAVLPSLKFDFIIIISHLDAMKDAATTIIEINKDNGFSKVNFE